MKGAGMAWAYMSCREDKNAYRHLAINAWIVITIGMKFYTLILNVSSPKVAVE
jgi:hypothetical protein